MVAALLLFLLQQTPAQRASQLVDAGVELSNRGRFAEAAEQFVQALALDPSIAEAHYLLGLIRQQDGRGEAAMQSFRAALKLSPKYAQAQARVCELETASARARETGYERALVSCHRAAMLDPRDPEPRFHKGWLLAKQGNHAGAAAEYKAVLRLDPKFPNARFELAMAYADLQNPGAAQPLLQEVVAGEPGNANARFQLGSTLAKRGDCAAALPHLKAATEGERKHYLLATCLKKLGREAESAAEFDKVKAAREGAEARMQAKYRAAVAHQKAEAGKLDEAIGEYRASLELVPDDSVRVDLAVALLRKGEAEAVVELLAGQGDPLAVYQTALAHARLRRREESHRLLEQAVAARPQFAEAWYQLGVIRAQMDNTAGAEKAFATATQLRPDEPAMRMAWAQTLEKLGRRDEAAVQRRIAGPGR